MIERNSEGETSYPLSGFDKQESPIKTGEQTGNHITEGKNTIDAGDMGGKRVFPKKFRN